MIDNEYLTESLIQERLRQIEAHGALRAMLRHAEMARRAREREASRDDPRPGRLGLWWQLALGRVAQLALPKSGVRL
jgi:hypothetical protein